MNKKSNDSELIAQSLQGNHRAYGELVNRYKNALYRHCYAILQDEAIAEDVAQETFVTAYFKLGLYKSDYKFATWLFKIGTNKALNVLRRSSKMVRVDDEFFAHQKSTLPSPHTQALFSELEQAIGLLKPKYQLALRLHYWQGLKYADIAEVMSVTEGTVKSLIFRAKAQLKKELL